MKPGQIPILIPGAEATLSIVELILPSTLITMPIFRNLISPVTRPPSPAQLVREFASKKKPRVLAATSAAIALSISSAFSNIHDTPSGSSTVQGSDSGWQTAYGAARMAVRIVNESSDMFLPLKAVVGALSVLIENCDVSVSCFTNWTPSHFLPGLRSSKPRIMRRR